MLILLTLAHSFAPPLVPVHSPFVQEALNILQPPSTGHVHTSDQWNIKLKTLSLLTSPHRASKVNLASAEFKLTWPSPLRPAPSIKPLKWLRTERRCLPKRYKPHTPKARTQTQITLKKRSRREGGEGRYRPQSSYTVPPKPRQKKRRWLIWWRVWARRKSRSCKTGSVYTAHPHKLASRCHPRPTTGFTHALWQEDQTAKWMEARGP